MARLLRRLIVPECRRNNFGVNFVSLICRTLSWLIPSTLKSYLAPFPIPHRSKGYQSCIFPTHDYKIYLFRSFLGTCQNFGLPRYWHLRSHWLKKICRLNSGRANLAIYRTYYCKIVGLTP